MACLTIGSHDHPISSETVWKHLQKAGAGPLRSRGPYRRIVLTLHHRVARLRRHVLLTRTDWARVLFADEKRFRLYSNDGRVRAYRRCGERYCASCILQTERIVGGSVMLSSGISLHTKTPPVMIDGNLTAIRYQNEVLRPILIPLFQRNCGMQLVQDGATAHTARTTMQLLQS